MKKLPLHLGRLRQAFFAVALLPMATTAQAPGEGFTLFAPMSSSSTYLLDNSGAIVHTWPSSTTPGLAVYLNHKGNLLRTLRNTSGPGGTGGRVQEIAWDGTVLWDYLVNDSSQLQHHDVAPLPNGNVLILAWDLKTQAQALAAGRDPSTLQGQVFRSEKVMEVRPEGLNGGTVVWEWRLWDHLVQDFNVSQQNFGVVGDHPELVDLNYPAATPQQGDWAHANGIDYDPLNDRIAISVRNLDEFWIIDHSTTTGEAAGHTGGNSGRGGDILYRWGNPEVYDAPGAARLDGQHDANFIPPGSPGEGNLMVFNNHAGPPFNPFSEVLELAPPVDAAGNFVLTPGAAYGPAQPTWEFTTPTPGDMFSPHVSGAVRLPNGNTLICSGGQGWFLEVSLSKQIVWQYTNALPSQNQNSVFKVRRYERYLWSSAQSLSAASGGSVSLELLAGVDQAGRAYLLAGSAGGTSPGLLLGSHLLPLNPLDPYFSFSVSSPNSAPLAGSLGFLDGLGAASASFSVPPGVIPSSLFGVELNHAYAVFEPTTGEVTHTSNAVPLTLEP